MGEAAGGQVTVIWRPRPGRVITYERGNPSISTSLFELWTRCDVCLWSGSLPCFHMGLKGADSMELCERCTGDQALVEQLLLDGWRFM